MTAMQFDAVALTSSESTRAFPKRASYHIMIYALPLLLALASSGLALEVANPDLAHSLPRADLAALNTQSIIAYTTPDSEIFDVYNDVAHARPGGGVYSPKRLKEVVARVGRVRHRGPGRPHENSQ